jgi:type IV secretory pathway TraG/TraD family ATPase VirD4
MEQLMDRLSGNNRFLDVAMPDLPEAPPASLKPAGREDGIVIPYWLPAPALGKMGSLYVTASLLARHLVLVGAIGTGKTQLFCLLIAAILAIMTDSDSMVVFDPKGDFRRRFYRPGIDIVVSASGSRDQRWNLFKELRPMPGPASSPVDDRVLNDICHMLFDRIAERSSQPFFGKAAGATWGGVTKLLAREEGASNARHLRFWESSSPDEIRDLLASDPTTRSLTTYVPENVEGQAMGVFAEIMGVERNVFQGNFAEPGGISIREAIRGRGGKTIFLDFDVPSADTLTDSYRLLVALAIREALQMGDENDHQAPGRVWFVIDELRRLPHVTQFETGMNFGRTAGLRFILGLQTTEQLKKDYEADSAPILAGAGSMFAFWVPDPQTREFIRGRGGKKLVRIAVPKVGIGDPWQDVREVDAISDQHILSLAPGQAIVTFPGQSPFRVQFPEYDKLCMAKGAGK